MCTPLDVELMSRIGRTSLCRCVRNGRGSRSDISDSVHRAVLQCLPSPSKDEVEVEWWTHRTGAEGTVGVYNQSKIH
jgi:hypothetical protein